MPRSKDQSGHSPKSDDDVVFGVSVETLKVRRRRRDEALAAGLLRHEASEFAVSNVDIGELRKLVDSDCPPRLIAKILL